MALFTLTAWLIWHFSHLLLAWLKLVLVGAGCDCTGTRGCTVSHPQAELIGTPNQKIQLSANDETKIEMSALSDICIFPFKSSSLRHHHLIQAPQLLRNAVHFKSDVWLALPATILIEILFFFLLCGWGRSVGGMHSCACLYWSESVVRAHSGLQINVLLQCSELLIMPCEWKFWQRACCISMQREP